MPTGLIATHADKSAKFIFGTSSALLGLVLIIALISSFQNETIVPQPIPGTPGVPGVPVSAIKTPKNWPEIAQLASGSYDSADALHLHRTLAQMSRIAYCQNSDYCPEHAGATVEGWQRGRLETTPPSGLQAITFVDSYDAPKKAVIAIRGTSLNTSRADGLADLCANLLMREGAMYRDLPEGCRDHFPEFILNYKNRIIDFVKTVLYGYGNDVGIVLTGHSLGAELAIHAALHIQDASLAVIGFSTSPHVGLEDNDGLSNQRFIRVIADRYDPVMQSSERPWLNASVCTYHTQDMPLSCFACYKENHTSFELSANAAQGFDWMLSGACGACFYEAHYFTHVLELLYSDDACDCKYYPGITQPVQSEVWQDVQSMDARTFPKPPEAPVAVPIGSLYRDVPPGWEDTPLNKVNALVGDEMKQFIGQFLDMSMIANCLNAPDRMCQIDGGADAKVEGWIRGPEQVVPEYGMHAITFMDNEEEPKRIVIAYRGTDFTIERIDGRSDLCATDAMLSGEWTPSVQLLANCTSLNRTQLQYMDRAEEFARRVQMKYPTAGVVFTGHSVGGMLALHSALHVTEWHTAAVAFSPSTSTAHGFDTFWGKKRYTWVFSDINDPMLLLANEKDWVGDICLFDIDQHLSCDVCRGDFLKDTSTERGSVTAFLGSQSCNECLEEAHPISHMRSLIESGKPANCWHYGNAE